MNRQQRIEKVLAEGHRELSEDATRERVSDHLEVILGEALEESVWWEKAEGLDKATLEEIWNTMGIQMAAMAAAAKPLAAAYAKRKKL